MTEPGVFKPAKNNQDSKSLFYSRVQYISTALELEDDNNLYRYIDFWYRRGLYGRINNDATSVYNLQESSLKQLVGDSKTLFAIDFVADAFQDMKEYYDNLIAKNYGEPSMGEIHGFTPRRGWKSVLKEYESHLDTLKDYFLREYLIDNTNQIENFNDILKKFESSLFNHTKDFPMTLTSFNLSNLCSPHTSGLIIELLEADHGDDEAKLEILQSTSFSVFSAAARKYGFYVNKNAPWALVADITSPVMKEYMKPYGVSKPSDYFKEYCYPTYPHDIERIKNFFLDVYYTFSNVYKYYEKVEICNGKSKKSTTTRNVLTIPEIDSILTDKYWVDLYINIRMEETETSMHPQEQERIRTRADLYRSKFDNLFALQHINDFFKQRDPRIMNIIEETNGLDFYRSKNIFDPQTEYNLFNFEPS